MRAVIVGGGHGCRDVLELVIEEQLTALSLEILGVVEINADAPGARFAKSQGWPVFARLGEAIELPGVELIIELTGRDEVLDEICRSAPEGVQVMGNAMARVFWDLDEVVKRLRADRRRIQDVLDSLPDAVMVVNGQGHVERVNRRFEELTGRSAADIGSLECSNHKCSNRLRAAQGDAYCPYLLSRTTSKAVTVVQRGYCSGFGLSATDAFFEIRATPVVVQGQPDTSSVVTLREVTEQIRLRRETEETARRFNQIIAAVHSLITIKGLDSRYQVVTPSAARLFGKSVEEFIGQTPGELFSPEVAARITANDRALLESGHFHHQSSFEEVFHINGQELVLISERMLLTDSRGTPVAICCVSSDVTDLRRLHREVLQSEKHAAMGKLAAGVAHEINNPLTGVLTFAEELLDVLPKKDPQRDDVEFIVRETLRCRQIVRDLLDFSRQSKPQRHPTRVEPIIGKAFSLVRHQACFHDICLTLNCEAEDQRIVVDPNQLQQVMLNLIINARDAMDGKGTISIRILEWDGDEWLAIEVIDHGCGIREEHLGQIFEPFFTTKGEQGNGLGLAAVQSVIEENMGEIHVESEQGKGAIFRALFPIYRPRSSSVAPPTPVAGLLRHPADRQQKGVDKR